MWHQEITRKRHRSGDEESWKVENKRVKADYQTTDNIISPTLHNTDPEIRKVIVSKNDGKNIISNFTHENKVKGSLRRHLNFWKDTLKANNFILQTIEHGYRIPFRYLPSSFYFQNNKSALRDSKFVETTLLELLKKEHIYEVKQPFTVSPLSVSQDPSGKKRLILDLSFVNKFVWQEKIKFDDLKSFENYIEGDKEGFLFKFDLKSGYHHVDIHKDSQKYLGFAWRFSDGTTKYLQYAVLPFGLTSGPFIFTKIVRVLIKYWRSYAIKIACFLDDGLSIEYTQQEQAIKNSKFVKKSLKCSGFIANHEKSQWEPTKVIQWLGVIIDFEDKVYKISEKRIQSIQNSIEFILSHPSRVTARQLARLAGKVISTKFVFGNIVRLKTRFLYRLIESRISWDKPFSLIRFNDVVSEILFWKFNLTSLNKRKITKYEVPQFKVFSDASSTGIGAVFNEKVCYRNLNSFERGESSAFRELLAIEHAVASFDTALQNKHILWHTDNTAAAQIVRVGSNKGLLHDLAISIHSLCHQKDIKLNVTWISRKLNQTADTVSKTIDYDDWIIKKEFFNFLKSLWGELSIDLFADNKNAKCQRFCSKYYCPGTFRVDAFSFDWTGEKCLMVPPTYLISKSIKHFLASKGSVEAVLVVPFWPSALFWPFLIENYQQFKSFVRDYRLFENSKSLISQGEYKGSIIGDPKNNVPILALLLKK